MGNLLIARTRAAVCGLRSSQHMLTRATLLGVAAALVLALATTCGPTLPPTTAPPQPDPTFEPLRATLQTYIDQTQPFRKQAEQVAERVPGKAAPTPAAEEAVRARQNALADALQTKLRANAKPGDILTPAIAEAITRQLEAALASVRRDLILDELAEQVEGRPLPGTPMINQPLAAPRVPPRRSEEHTSELQSQSNLVCRLLLEKKKNKRMYRAAAPIAARSTT